VDRLGRSPFLLAGARAPTCTYPIASRRQGPRCGAAATGAV